MLNGETTLAIILGVSECPRAPSLQTLPQCANSAEDFDRYLRTKVNIPSNNVINLFDSQLSASEQIDQIDDWLARAKQNTSERRPTDLLVFYSGHGGFTRTDQAYFLAVRRTREGAEGSSSIRYIDLASTIKRHADTIRKYLILDCCFAAAAVVRMQTDLSQLVVQRVEDELPRSGTAVLCSSAAKLVSLAPEGERHTMFAGALLQCLRDGIQNQSEALSLEQVGQEVRQLIANKYPNDAVRPELHVPDQFRGNPAEIPLFPNPSWKRDHPEPTVSGSAPPVDPEGRALTNTAGKIDHSSERRPFSWSRLAAFAIGLLLLFLLIGYAGLWTSKPPVEVADIRAQSTRIANPNSSPEIMTAQVVINYTVLKRISGQLYCRARLPDLDQRAQVMNKEVEVRGSPEEQSVELTVPAEALGVRVTFRLECEGNSGGVQSPDQQVYLPRPFGSPLPFPTEPKTPIDATSAPRGFPASPSDKKSSSDAQKEPGQPSEPTAIPTAPAVGQWNRDLDTDIVAPRQEPAPTPSLPEQGGNDGNKNSDVVPLQPDAMRSGEKADADPGERNENRKGPEAPASSPTPQKGIAQGVPQNANVDDSDIARRLQEQLRRVGCLREAADGKWDEKSQRALSLLNKNTDTRFDVKLPSIGTLDALSKMSPGTCPPICERGYRAEGAKCIKIRLEKPNEPAPRPVQPTPPAGSGSGGYEPQGSGRVSNGSCNCKVHCDEFASRGQLSGSKIAQCKSDCEQKYAGCNKGALR